VSWLPLYHDMGFIACLNLPLAHGVHTVMLDPIDWVSDPALFLRAASAHRATLAWNPNFAYAFMSERARDGDLTGIDLRPLRGLVNCSEPVTFESQRRFLDRFAPLGARDDAFCGCYAMAETTFALTHGSARDAQYVDDRGPDGAVAGVRKYVSTGRPLEGVDIAIMNAGSRAGDRRLGEIWVRSPFTFSRYYDDAAETERAFVDGWYRTGDVGYMADGNLYVTGRKKDVMIVAGVNVYPQDVEALVSIVEGVRPGRVSSFSRFDERQQTEHITVLAESDLTGAEADSAVLAIRQRLLAGLQIANFSVHLVPPQWLVKSSSGKMAHRENRKKWELRQGSASRSQSSVEAS
jgi:fatty-acyl-CoA synthase